jgi:hypothetical protein
MEGALTASRGRCSDTRYFFCDLLYAAPQVDSSAPVESDHRDCHRHYSQQFAKVREIWSLTLVVRATIDILAWSYSSKQVIACHGGPGP